MSPRDIESVLDAVAAGRLTVASACERLARLPFEDLGFARADHHRALRCGGAEAIYAPGKTDAQIAALLIAIAGAGQVALATRVEPTVAEGVQGLLGVSIPPARAEYNPVARTLTLPPAQGMPTPVGGVLVVAAGTADLPVASEAQVTAQALGARAELIVDVGVAGLHRLWPELPRLRAAHALVVVAGMEAALPSVIGGLTPKPIIAVPTSVGYGAHLGGIVALLGMLNSCAAGVAVVNIDAGFKAGWLAARINAGVVDAATHDPAMPGRDAPAVE